MNIIKKCPVCQKNISLWTVVKPGIWDSEHSGEIVCTQCNHVVSRFWHENKEYFSIIEIVLFITSWFITSESIAFIKLLTTVTVVLFILLYSFIKLKDWGEKKSLD